MINTNKLNNKNTSIKKWTAYSFPSNSESHAECVDFVSTGIFLFPNPVIF